MALKCAACGKFLRPAGGADCTSCSRAYHKACVSLPEAEGVARGWECPECWRSKPKGNNTNTPVKGVSAAAAAPELPRQSDGTSADVFNLQATSPPPTSYVPPSSDSSSEVGLLRRELAEFMKEIREEFRSFRSTIMERMDRLENRLVAVEQREQAQIPNPNQILELQATVAHLKSSLNDRDQEAMLSDLDIGHLPETTGENVSHTVTVLAAKLGVAINEQDIVFAERVGRNYNTGGEAAAGRPRRVVVRLARRSLRDELLRAARVRRSLAIADAGQSGPPRRVFVNERLTRTNQQLFHSAREESRKREWRFCWTRQGRIYVRKAEGHQVHLIRTTDDITRVFGNNTV